MSAPNHPPVNDRLQPPTRLFDILKHAGPGLIVAGSIVGSGELIATTKTGAEAGFTLLWLIILGCIVKVFAQIELARYSLQSGKTTLAAMNEVPGPRWRGKGNWLVWYWMLMWVASISQLGGIVGSVGQSLAISAPLSEMGVAYNKMADAAILEALQSKSQSQSEPIADDISAPAESSTSLRAEYLRKYASKDGSAAIPGDVMLWTVLVTLVTSVMLVIGRYSLIQSLSTAFVGLFTLVTVLNLLLIQMQPEFSISAAEFLSGMTFSLPTASTEDAAPIATALATFGIIGVGAAELVAYPYWCLEQGYAKHTGPDDGTAAWNERAAGWLRVMRFDAWGSMVVYTFTTMAFYLLGASILSRAGLNPPDDDLVRTLAVMFVPVFSDWASTIFLVGAFAVLYSTFFIANAGHARTFSDAMRVLGWIADDEATRELWIRRLSGFFPLLCLLIYFIFPKPTKLVLFSGVMQGIMLPMLAAAALYLRYFKCSEALRPSKAWDVALWVSGFAMLITGGWTVIAKLFG